ncbi:MAG: hypothetical protein WBD40_18965 [Tepidisphaeraceae bacterium]
MQKLDVATQHEFVDALRTRLVVPKDSGSSHDIRMGRLVQSIREAREMLVADASDEAGRVPSLTEERYCELRVRFREADWVAPSTMRAWVRGSWNDVLRRANVETVEGGDTLVAQTGGAYTWDEIRLGLRECAVFWRERGHDDFSFRDFLSWANLPQVLGTPGRRPRSQGPFDAYSGFMACKAQALRAADAPPPDGRSRQVRAGIWRPSSGYGYEEAQLREALDEVVAYIGKVPRPGEFVAARRAILDEESAQGMPPRAFASYNKLINTWKPWDAALVACGYRPFRAVSLDGETGRGRYVAPDRHRISEEDLFAGVLEAYEAKGRPFSKVDYEEYIQKQRFVSRAGRPMATYTGMYSRYRHRTRQPWRWVCEQALPDGWNRRLADG